MGFGDRSATGRRRVPVIALTIAVVVIVALNGVALALEPSFMRVQMYDLQYSAVRVLDYERAPRPDVVFMGTSRVLNGFDPAQTEAEIARSDGVAIHALNLGVAGGAIDVNYLILENIIRANKQPSVIVYGLSEFELDSLTSDALAQRINMPLLERLHDFALYSGRTVEDKVSFVLKRLIPLYRDHDLIRNALSIRFDPSDPAHKFYAENHDLPPNGFVQHPPDSHASDALLELNRQEYDYQLSHFAIAPAPLARLHAFIALAHSRGIAVVLVNMPVAPQLRAFWRSEEKIKQYRATVQSVADSEGAPLLDLYEDEDHYMPTDGFFDFHHLNLTGTRVITNLVTQRYLIDRFKGGAAAEGHISATLTNLAFPTLLAPGARVTGTVDVRNEGAIPWRGDGSGSPHLTYRWLNTNGDIVAPDGRDVPPAVVAEPGQQAHVVFTITGASVPGSYVLEVGLVDAGGNVPLRQAVTIGAPGPVFTAGDPFRATLSDLQAPQTMPVGAHSQGSITIRNDSQSSWPTIEPAVHLSYHWLDPDGHEIVHDGTRTNLPMEVQPGQHVRLDFAIEAPKTPGVYTLDVDLVYEGVGWFGMHGSVPARQSVIVGAQATGRAPTAATTMG